MLNFYEPNILFNQAPVELGLYPLEEEVPVSIITGALVEATDTMSGALTVIAVEDNATDEDDAFLLLTRMI